MAVTSSQMSNHALLGLRANVTSRLETLRSYRLSWWAYWGELARMYLPHRHRWFTTPNKYNRGSPKNEAILDPIGLIAARVLSTGLLSGLTSPTKPWMRLGIHGMDNIPEGDLKQWLSNTTATILEIYAGSNFYQAHAQAYYDEVVFGTAPIIQYDDFDDIVRFYVPESGEYFLGVDAKLRPDTLYREYTYTAKQCIEEFGYENCSIGVQQMGRRSGGSTKDTEVVLCHAIEPNSVIYYGNTPITSPIPRKFKWREVYWEQGSAGGQKNAHIMRATGYNECPFVALRWDVTANDAYGRCPGMYALPDVLTTQVQALRKAEAIDKLVRPPMVASVSMRNEPMNILPGGVTYVADPAASGFKPAFQVDPRLQEMDADIEQKHTNIRTIFFNDLFMGISQLSTVRTATEIEARKNEIVIQVGPVIERNENEGLSLEILRTYRIGRRRGLIPPPPGGIPEESLKIRYISLIADTQRASTTNGLERLLQVAGGMYAIKPDVIDNLDYDKIIQYYGDRIDVEPSLFNGQKVIAAIRQAREQQQQAQAALNTGATAAQAGQTLSQTDVGGGVNALQAILGRQGGARGETLQ